ncbi:pyridoxal-phosphate dependent enzyme [Leucobacter sp. CSA1]|uniref:Pyridoxal-phosphate dependent enzyme n=1 Tax=Leucobacter chromiisoli TaxID=2796471 RepID=A0A934UV74_9MICO|nr:pyridoxal-phosphate dependent enzyme [Leucobacter chromiisoli]MBK0418652.1 pyridoxal-phosphate dependent enzyme [Leucobacter chromiisoli]
MERHEAVWELHCVACGRIHADGHASPCLSCEAPVSARRRGGAFSVREGAPGIWQYAEPLGLDPEGSRFSLGETMTPLLPDANLAERHGLASAHLKLDHLCPTGSFKDRAVAAGVAQAAAQGSRGIVCASSGNAAASAAAYGARAGIPVVLVMPAGTPPGKLLASGAYGAVQLLVEGDYSVSFAVAKELGRRSGFANVTTTYVNPAAVAALRSTAYDLFRQLGEAPDAVIVPTSAGPLVHGVVAGFEDLRDWGLVDAVPRVIAAQPEGCSPIARAWDRGEDRVTEWERVTTDVSGLDDPLRGYAHDGTLTLEMVRRSGGSAIAVPDARTASERRTLAERSGVHVEPAGAIGVAALTGLRERGLVSAGERVVCLLTGAGFKRPLETERAPLRAASIEAALELAEAAEAVGTAAEPRRETIRD